jgi:hypothetical protein
MTIFLFIVFLFFFRPRHMGLAGNLQRHPTGGVLLELLMKKKTDFLTRKSSIE